MKILALDAATEACSAALLVDDAMIERYVESGKSHAAQLLDMVRELVAEAGLGLAALDCIAVSVGPGSFTGVRVGVAVAQGLAFGAGLPALPVSTLDALALQSAPQRGDAVFSCLDARMGEVYSGWFRADARRGVDAIDAPRVSPPTQLQRPAVDATTAAGRHLGIGRGLQVYPALTRELALCVTAADLCALPHAAAMARLATLRMTAGEAIDPTALQPQYLRNKVAMTEAERGVQYNFR
jgi:tRNA threonylcarbamoyladenosine biosynthesis protein TsaB